MGMYHNRPHVQDIRKMKAKGEKISMLYVSTLDEGVCGYGVNHKPRHGKVYAELGPKLTAIQEERVSAMKAFRADVDNGGYPGPEHTVPIKDDEFNAFLKRVKA